ncbi:glutathione S-transferase family protein [Aquibium oceanicum]|uniref:Glutathione S-transferase n=1 Tax=Aquibium oceanicum TaxID=1670800 RepID=A0A1L3SQ65_9HYPH|nr:glutathione S-transferase family protein [Aquibium oceanicum]APH71556.1 glutathione S-transferase [Aquibium oceanicum]
MILIGQYDSSFVRRVGIALTLYGLPFEHRPWSTFGDAERLREFNPLVKVPTLVLDDGEVLIDSHMIIDHLDSLVEPERRMFPASEPERRRAMKIAALATGMADNGVSLFYETYLHQSPSAMLVERRRGQVLGALRTLEEDRAARSTPYWFGETIGHADVAVACALRHVGDSLPGLIDPARYPQVHAHAARLESLEVFQAVSQPFVPPS